MERKSQDDQEIQDMVLDITDGVYMFDLKMLCGGYAYFSTFTYWCGFGISFREFRKPRLVDMRLSYEMLRELGHFTDKNFLQKNLIIGDDDQYQRWLYRKGWGFVTKHYSRRMSQWLKRRECVRSPLGIHTDIELVPPSTLKQSARSGGPRNKVLERDGKECLLCGAKTQLTMQHVIPYSMGGETTSRNLVTLCNDCNQKCGVELLTELYDMASLPHGFDPSLVKTPPSKGAIHQAGSLSNNLMQTRCEVW